MREGTCMSDKTFNEKYEEFMDNLMKDTSWIWEGWDSKVPELNYGAGLREPSHSFKAGLSTDLRLKRDFGVQKYGEKSFQSNETNAAAVDVINHALEEMIDYINYTLHRIYQASVSGDIAEVEYCKKRFQLAVSLLYMTR